MSLTTRSFKWGDRDVVRALAAHEAHAIRIFSDYLKNYFTPEGTEIPHTQGFVDGIIVAVENDHIVGYYHFYTNCYENYENALEVLIVDSSLSPQQAVEVGEILNQSFLNSKD